MESFSLRRMPPVLLASFILLVLVVWVLNTLLTLNHGQFSFSLDDPYIHFALAEHILQGHYGINEGEYAAPSSSIIWPFLVAPFMLLEQGDYAVLGLNVLLSLGTLAIAANLFDQMIDAESRKKWHAKVIMLVCLILWSNMVGLIFTGMEHSLHVFLTILLLHGLIGEARTRTVSAWLVTAIVVAPLVRYEAAAFSGVALLYLFFRGHRLASVLMGLALLLTVGGFSLFLKSLGLNYLPSSVTAKSVTMGAGGVLNGILWNMADQVLNFTGAWLYFLFFGLLYGFVKRRVDDAVRVVIPVCLGALLLHFVAGRSGWFGRYDIYATVIAVMMFFHAYRAQFSAYLQRASLKAFYLRSVATTLILFLPFVFILLSTPLGSHNIFQQQYQMGRFVQEFYRKPVGVNDLGWVAFRNDEFVLDYGGLASLEVQQLRKQQERNGGVRAPALGALTRYGVRPSSSTLVDQWMDDLAQKHDVKLVMIYDIWFNRLPSHWQKVAELELAPTLPSVVVPHRTVSFYVLDAAEVPAVKQQLARFAAVLPEGPQLKLL